MFGGGGFGGGGYGGGRFEASYRCYPVSFLDKQEAERGDKVFLPPSALDRLGARQQVAGLPGACRGWRPPAYPPARPACPPARRFAV